MTDSADTTRTYHVPGISCDHCVAAITEHVGAVAAVAAVSVDIDARRVSVTGGDDDAIVAAIEDAGYEVD